MGGIARFAFSPGGSSVKISMGVVGGAAAAALLCACSQPGVPVVTAAAVRGDIAVRQHAAGSIAPGVTVKAKVSGQLEKVTFTEGQLVQQGDVLAEIDARPYQAALALAQANLARDLAIMARAGTGPQNASVTPVVIAAEKVAVTAAQVKLGYTHVLAPAAGRAGLRQIDPGNNVTPDDANGIVVITEEPPTSALFLLPQEDGIQIGRRLSAGAVMPVTLLDQSNRKRLGQGRLVSVDSQIDANTGTLTLHAHLDSTEGTLMASQAVNVQLLVDTLHDQVLIPESAVLRDGNGSFVYLFDPSSSTVRERTVKIGVIDGDMAAVTAGVSPGDVVVTRSVGSLHDGERVQQSTPGDRRTAGG